jgi:hypothetical protein
MGCVLSMAQYLSSVAVPYLALLQEFYVYMPHLLVFSQPG